MLENENTGIVIRDLRLRLAMTQEKFATALGVTYSAVNRWENGHTKPSKLALFTIVRLANSRGIAAQVSGRRILIADK